jgi:hypothetical protein
MSAGDNKRHGRHPVTDFHLSYISADLDDLAGTFMPQDNGRVAGIFVVVVVNVGTAYANRLDRNLHIGVPDSGFWHIAQFDFANTVRVFYQSYH